MVDEMVNHLLRQMSVHKMTVHAEGDIVDEGKDCSRIEGLVKLWFRITMYMKQCLIVVNKLMKECRIEEFAVS